MKVVRLLIGLSVFIGLGSCEDTELYGSWQCVEVKDATMFDFPLAKHADISSCSEIIVFDIFHQFITSGQVSEDSLFSYYKYDKKGRHLNIGGNQDFRILRLTRDTLIIKDTILEGQLEFVDNSKRVYAKIHE
jgi:hypothetical protein